MPMYKTLIILTLLLTPLLSFAAEPAKPKSETAGPPKPKPEFTQEQLDKLKASEEQYKDNPAMMKVIKQIKEQSGITDEPPPTPMPTETAQPKQPSLQGSRTTADAAYDQGDYETAISHYKTLAAEGDPEASLILGVMYERGQGTEVDTASASTWYRRAAEAQPDNPDNPGKVLLEGLERFSMTEEDKVKADQKYEEINKEIAGESKPETPDQKSETAPQAEGEADSGSSQTVTMPTTRGKQVQYVYELKSRVVKFTPEKIEHMQHLRLEGQASHLQPEKFIRQQTGKQG